MRTPALKDFRRTFGLMAAIACLGATALAPGRAAAGSDDDIGSAAYQRCNSQTEGRTIPLRECDAAELARQDQSLNATYKALEARLEPEDKASLVKAERAWLAYRQAECQFEASGERGGTEWPLLVNLCTIKRTEQRISDLQQALDDAKSFSDSK